MSHLTQNIQRIQKKIKECAEKKGKNLQDITLVAVSKTFDADLVNHAIDSGIEHIGENRVQEARDKFPHILRPVTKHMIGHLQRNKVKYAVELFDMIQSVDSIELANEINKRTKKRIPVFIEVNTSGEKSKYGCHPEEALNLLRNMSGYNNLIVKGFMTIAIFSSDAEKVRPCFKILKKIYDEAKSMELSNADISTLSMGMSADFEVAIEEGANMVRIGTAIFGERRFH
jgi:pyridoxal phosphate enzyme (YggS family)